MSATSTTVIWERLVGARLEELMYGLLEAMGARDLVWRAGTATGVTAADAGRDLEAVFDRPTPDGDLDRSTWWIEAKGRREAVPKNVVVKSVMEAGGAAGVDVLVICTNSRFSNPTRDWVSEWQRSHPLPKIRLWDRDRLAELVRKHPLVAARVVPEALPDADRLLLLIERFESLGETPDIRDLQHFWTNRAAIDPDLVVRAVGMFAYTETDRSLVEHPWAELLEQSQDVAIEAVIQAAIRMPSMLFSERPRGLSAERLVEVGAYLVIAVMGRLDTARLQVLLDRPWEALEDPGPWSEPIFQDAWRESMLEPLVARIQEELAVVCADDCVRVITELTAFGPSFTGERFWHRFERDPDHDDRYLQMERTSEPCAVGLPLDRSTTCPLIGDPSTAPDHVAALREIAIFRRAHPDGQFLLLSNPVRQRSRDE